MNQWVITGIGALLGTIGGLFVALFGPLIADVTQDWTAFGLLVTVLGSIGVFLKWYLPARDDAFRMSLAEDRSAWITQLTAEQNRSERVISSMSSQFREAIQEFKSANHVNTVAIGEVRDCLRDLQNEIREART